MTFVMTDPLFISSPVSVLTGDAARVALETTNDTAHYTEGKGVLSVPLERWQEAQEYERATWLEHGLMLTEDRNAEHAALFDNYKSLPEHLGDVIELGCGPFTNLRHIMTSHKTSTITLLDPLALWYQQKHPHCAYKRVMGNSELCGKLCIVVPESIENFEKISYTIGIDRGTQYDTLVMVNVLSHCQSVEKVFGWISTHLKQGGSLVFHEPARDIDPHQIFDVGHPLSYTQDVIDTFLSGYTPAYKNGDYFIGVKK